MEVRHPRCCGLDVHKETVVACVRRVIDGKTVKEVRTFSTTTADLIAHWNIALQVFAIDERRAFGSLYICNLPERYLPAGGNSNSDVTNPIEALSILWQPSNYQVEATIAFEDLSSGLSANCGLIFSPIKAARVRPARSQNPGFNSSMEILSKASLTVRLRNGSLSSSAKTIGDITSDRCRR